MRSLPDVAPMTSLSFHTDSLQDDREPASHSSVTARLRRKPTPDPHLLAAALLAAPAGVQPEIAVRMHESTASRSCTAPPVSMRATFTSSLASARWLAARDAGSAVR